MYICLIEQERIWVQCIILRLMLNNNANISFFFFPIRAQAMSLNWKSVAGLVIKVTQPLVSPLHVLSSTPDNDGIDLLSALGSPWPVRASKHSKAHLRFPGRVEGSHDCPVSIRARLQTGRGQLQTGSISGLAQPFFGALSKI